MGPSQAAQVNRPLPNNGSASGSGLSGSATGPAPAQNTTASASIWPDHVSTSQTPSTARIARHLGEAKLDVVREHLLCQRGREIRPGDRRLAWQLGHLVDVHRFPAGSQSFQQHDRRSATCASDRGRHPGRAGTDDDDRHSSTRAIVARESPKVGR